MEKKIDLFVDISKKNFEWEWKYKKTSHDRLLPVIAGVPQGAIGQQLQGVGIPAIHNVTGSLLQNLDQSPKRINTGNIFLVLPSLCIGCID